MIEIKNVNFRYKGSDEGSLENLSLTIHYGETVLLCGSSGCGKTTVGRLINGLIPHYYKGELTGSVTVNGRDIAQTELYDLAGVVGTVFQNPRSQFFAIDTDGEITFGAENIGMPPEDIVSRKNDVAREMHIERLLDRSIFELSGGEKQKLMLARALYKDAPVIILDEPTAALDPIAENELYLKYSDLTKNKTSVYISHRLASTRFCDRIIYIENGEIAEAGTHDELMNLGGKYAYMYNLQSHYYKEVTENA